MKTIKGMAVLTNITVAEGQQAPFMIFVGEDGTAFAGPFVVVAKFEPGKPVQVDAQPGTPPEVLQAVVNAAQEVKTASERRIII